VMAGEDAPARYRQSAGDDHDRGPSATPRPIRPQSRWPGRTGGSRSLSPSVSLVKPVTWASPSPTSAAAGTKARCHCGRYWST
jgi:hypothetical protein